MYRSVRVYVYVSMRMCVTYSQISGVTDKLTSIPAAFGTVDWAHAMMCRRSGRVCLANTVLCKYVIVSLSESLSYVIDVLMNLDLFFKTNVRETIRIQ